MLAVEPQGAVDVATLDVPLDAQVAEEFAAAVRETWISGQPLLVIDLQKTPLIDSAGLEMLVDLQHQASLRGGLVKLAAPNALCADILHASGVEQRFEVFETAKMGVGSFAR